MNLLSVSRADSARRMDGLPASVFAWLDELKARARARRIDLLDLGIGSPDRPTPPAIIAELQRAVSRPECHGYPAYRGTSAFRAAASAFLHRRFGVSVDPETEVLPVSGAEEGFTHLALAYLDERAGVLLPGIHYPVHERGPLLAQAPVHQLPLTAERGYLPDLDAAGDDVASASRMLILNYPHNPTGAVATREFLQRALEFCARHDILLVSDLAYSELTFDGYVAPSIFELDGAREVAIEVHSFSKSFNMAGFRMAFLVGAAALLEPVFRLRTSCSYGTPTAFQEAGAYALAHAAELTPPIAALYRHRRDAVLRAFAAKGITGEVPRGTMFVWLPVPAGFGSEQWTEHLVESAGLVVTPGNAFGPDGEGYFRVSLVAEAEIMTAAIARLEY